MNWYDVIVIDRLWVGYSRFWIAGAAIAAGIIVLLF